MSHAKTQDFAQLEDESQRYVGVALGEPLERVLGEPQNGRIRQYGDAGLPWHTIKERQLSEHASRYQGCHLDPSLLSGDRYVGASLQEYVH